MTCEPVLCHFIVVMNAKFDYLDEKVAAKTEFDQEPEHHASKHHLDDVANASNSCIRSVLNLGLIITDYLYDLET